MNPLLAAALEVQTFCRAQGWRFCFIGGLAVQRWGEPRLTQDADLTIITGFGNEEPFVDTLLGQFRGRRADARDFALRYRVVLVRASTGAPVDISLGAMPFEERAVDRASEFEIGPGVVISTCSAEDLVVFKAFAGRVQDWLDIEGIVARQDCRLDERLIWRELLPLLDLKEVPEDAERLHPRREGDMSIGVVFLTYDHVLAMSRSYCSDTYLAAAALGPGWPPASSPCPRDRLVAKAVVDAMFGGRRRLFAWTSR